MMSELQCDIVYVLYWGDLVSIICMLVIVLILCEVYKCDCIVLLIRLDFESFFKYSFYFNVIEIDVFLDQCLFVFMWDKCIKVVYLVCVYDFVGSNDSCKLKKLFCFFKCEWVEVVVDVKFGQYLVDDVVGKLNVVLGYQLIWYQFGEVLFLDVFWVDYLVKKLCMLELEYFGLFGVYVLLCFLGENVKV